MQAEGFQHRILRAVFRRERVRDAEPEDSRASVVQVIGEKLDDGAAQAILAAMDASNQELANCTRAMFQAVQDGDQQALATSFAAMPATSIDYAVMENAPQVAVLEADLQWNDLGSFPSLGAAADKDPQGNVSQLYGGATVIQKDSRDCIVYGEGPRTVALFGVNDLVVVAVDDVVLVCPRAQAEELKTLIEHIRSTGREDLL